MRTFTRRTLECGLIVCLGVGATTGPALAKEPSIEQRLFGMAEAQARQGNLASAVPDLERVMKLNPRHTGARFFLGLHHMRRGEVETARKLLEGVGNDPEYGSRARRHLQEMTMEKSAGSDLQSIQTYIAGGAFPEALRDCKRALIRSPQSHELLYWGVVAAAMTNDRVTSGAMIKRLAAANGPGVDDLQHFLEAWFSQETAPRMALEKLRGIRDRRLMFPAVHKAIRGLSKKLGLNEDYENYLLAERERPGSDRVSLDRELVRHYIDRGMFQKGISLIEARSIESIEDNLLLVELNTLAGDEAKARRLARTLLVAGRDEDLIRVAWMKAFLHEWERLGAPPSGPDESGGTIDEFARENVVSVMRGRSEMTSERLLTALRVAASVKESEFIKPILNRVMQIQLAPELMPDASAAARDLADNGQRTMSITFLEWMLGQEPEDVETQRLLAENYYLEGRTDESIKMLEGVLQKTPDSIRTFFLLVDAMIAAGKTQEAHQRILERLKDSQLEPLPRRQLEAKALMLAGNPTPGSASGSTEGQTGSGSSSADGLATDSADPSGGPPRDPLAGATVPDGSASPPAGPSP